MSQITGEGPDGTPTVPKVTAEGEIKVAVTGGIEGQVDTELGDPITPTESDANAPAPVVITRLQAQINGADGPWSNLKAVTGQATADTPALAVALTTAPTLTTQPAQAFSATATPALDAPGAVVRVAGQVDTGADLEAAGEGTGIVTKAYQGGGWSATISNSPDKPIFAQGSDGENPERLATQADQAAQTTAIGDVENAIQSLETEVSDDATTADVQAVGSAVAAVETELQDKATEATLATRASEATLATRASEATAANIYGRLGDRRTADGAAAGGGQVVRPLLDVADFVQTTPGSPTWYLQARNSPGRLKSIQVTLQTTGSPFYLFVMDVSGYLPPPAAQPAVTTRRHLGFVAKGTANDPGIFVVSFDREELQAYSAGILIALSTTASTFTPATTALASIESYTLGVPS